MEENRLFYLAKVWNLEDNYRFLIDLDIKGHASKPEDFVKICNDIYHYFNVSGQKVMVVKYIGMKKKNGVHQWNYYLIFPLVTTQIEQMKTVVK
jgi:hypothetical protein